MHLRLQFSHLNEHKFRHGLSDTKNLMCACRVEIETTEHFLSRFQFYGTQRYNFLIILRKLTQTFKV